MNGQNFCTNEPDDFIEGVKLFICKSIAVIFLLTDYGREKERIEKIFVIQMSVTEVRKGSMKHDEK